MKIAEISGKKINMRKNCKKIVCAPTPLIPLTIEVKIKKNIAPRITADM